LYYTASGINTPTGDKYTEIHGQKNIKKYIYFEAVSKSECIA